MFSATFPKVSRALAKEYMANDFIRVRIGRAGSTHKNVIQDIVYVERNQKKEALYDLLFSREACRTLVFCNSKGAVEELDDYLWNKQIPTVFMHGGRSQLERQDAMSRFKSKQPHVLIATNVFGRGIDIPEVKHVVNFELPSLEYGGISEYIHRIGRTGRIGHVGHATSFYNERNEELAPFLVNILIETEQTVPDFLEDFKPEDGKIEFDDDTDNESESKEAGYVTGSGDAGATSGWGNETVAPAETSAGGWGTETVVGAPVVGWGTEAAEEPVALSSW
jgi:ATP-dependent RNA helicase DDX3X